MRITDKTLAARGYTRYSFLVDVCNIQRRITKKKPISNKMKGVLKAVSTSNERFDKATSQLCKHPAYYLIIRKLWSNTK